MTAYSERRMTLAIDFVNTFDPAYDDPELLGTIEEATRFLRAHGMEDARVDETELDELRGLRDQLRAAVVSRDPDAIAAVVNDLLGTARVAPRLARDQSDVWSVDFASVPDARLVDRVSTEAALGLALALVRHGLDRLRVCASDPCREIFLDVSRNRSRRYCSDRCANRHNVAAFRERQRNVRGGE